MIIIHVMGGLGNQLYQYALYELFHMQGKNVKLDTFAYSKEARGAMEWRKLELTRFPSISYEEATKQEREAMLDNSMSLTARIKRGLVGRNDKTFKETKGYMPEILTFDDCYLYGYWGCEKYYEDIIPILQKKIQFPVSNNPKQQACVAKINQENAVSIHVRRSDYLTVLDGKRYMGICTGAYYESAIEYIKEHVENPVFYIFSDDVEYCKEYFREENMIIVDWNTGDDSLFDMQLMSLCKHNICANSTFSMWGARLNQNAGKMMIRPVHQDNYETAKPEKVKELWKQWILIDHIGDIYE